MYRETVAVLSPFQGFRAVLAADGYAPAHRDAVAGIGDSHLDALLRRAALNGNVDVHVRSALTPRQRTLLEVVNDEPALNIREIADRLAVQRTAAKHHVATLLRQGYLATHRQGRHVLHFTNWMPLQERKALAALRIGSARTVVGAAFATPGINTAQLADRLALSPRTVRSTIRLLRHQGLVRLEKVPRSRARLLHLETDTRIVWARWFDTAHDGTIPAPLQGEPTRLAVIGLFFLSWLTWSNS